MQDAVYAMYLGTLVTLAAAIRGSDERLARQIIADALCLSGVERFSQLLAIDDASIGVRRSREDVFRAVQERMQSARVAA